MGIIAAMPNEELQRAQIFDHRNEVMGSRVADPHTQVDGLVIEEVIEDRVLFSEDPQNGYGLAMQAGAFFPKRKYRVSRLRSGLKGVLATFALCCPAPVMTLEWDRFSRRSDL